MYEVYSCWLYSLRHRLPAFIHFNSVIAIHCRTSVSALARAQVSLYIEYSTIV